MYPPPKQELAATPLYRWETEAQICDMSPHKVQG